MRKVQAFFLKNSREIGGKGSIPSRRHPMGVGGLYNPRTCRAGARVPRREISREIGGKVS